MNCIDDSKDSFQSQTIENPRNQLEPIEENEEITTECEYEITPPSTPPSPPGPPPPPSPHWTQQDFNFYTDLIQEHLNKLENIVKGPHIITVNGIQQLRPYSGQNWRDKLNQLLFETRIPFFWIIECSPEEENEEVENDVNECSPYEPDKNCPHSVHIHLISHSVENKVYEILENYFQNEYDNVVYIT